MRAAGAGSTARTAPICALPLDLCATGAIESLVLVPRRLEDSMEESRRYYTGSRLTSADVATLNAARHVLYAMTHEYGSTREDGVLHAKAETAEVAIFDVLNTAKHVGGVPISDSELHITRTS